MPNPVAGTPERLRPEYQEVNIPAFGSMNTDASDAVIRPHEPSDVLNLRQVTSGEYRLRTGYRTIPLDIGTSATYVLCKCEYRYDDKIFDISIIQKGTDIRLVGINRIAIAGSAVWSTQFTPVDLGVSVATVAASPVAVAASIQYLSSISLTIYGVGTFNIDPAGTVGAATQFDTWSVSNMGKVRANAPRFMRAAKEFKGDLFLTVWNDRVDQNIGTTRFAHHLTTRKRAITKKDLLPPYEYTRIPLGCKYQRVEDLTPLVRDSMDAYQWEKNDADPSGTSRLRGLPTRAWSYRFVFILEKTDARGNKITYRSAPSSDVPFMNTMYVPPQIFRLESPAPPQLRRISQFLGDGNSYMDGESFSTHGWVSSAGTWGFTTDGPNNGFVPEPSQADINELAKSFIKYYGQDYKLDTYYGDEPTGFDEDLLLGAMYWLGFRRRWLDAFDREEVNFDDTFRTPWFTMVPASELASAPIAEIAWDWFAFNPGGGPNPEFPSNVKSIEIYRTAYAGSDETFTDGSPLFEPHTYGYVGTIKKDEIFIDSVKDRDIDWAKTPDTYDGLLEGEFSASVMNTYKGKLVLGNLSENFHIYDPAHGKSSTWTSSTMDGKVYEHDYPFIMDGSANSLNFVDLYTNAADGLPIILFAFQYGDSAGNLSDFVMIAPQNENGNSTFGRFVSVIPYGYDPTITIVNVYFSRYSGGVRTWRLIKSVPVEKGYIDSDESEYLIAPPVSAPTATTKVTKDIGSIIWSNVNSQFDFPGENFRNIHQSAPVMAMEDLIGPFWIFTDRSADLDTLVVARPRGEPENRWVGCIGRFAYAKVDKLVFFLSSSGLYYADADGVYPYPANVQQEILEYLTEMIPGKAELANVRRASMGYLYRRQELWLYLPSSYDLGGNLPPKLFIFKFLGGDVRSVLNYKFELTTTINETSLSGNPPVFPTDGSVPIPTIFQITSDNKLFTTYVGDGGAGHYSLITQDVDVDDIDFIGRTAIEFIFGLQKLNSVKFLRFIEMTGDFDCVLKVGSGRPDLTHQSDYSDPLYPRGLVGSGSTFYEAKAIRTDGDWNVKIPHIPAPAPVNTTSHSPVIRFVTQPRDGNNMVAFRALTVRYEELHVESMQ